MSSSDPRWIKSRVVSQLLQRFCDGVSNLSACCPRNIVLVSACHCSAYSGGSNPHPLFKPLAGAIAQHGLSRQWLDRIIDARVRGVAATSPTGAR